MRYLGDFMLEKVMRNMHRNTVGKRKREPVLDQDVADWLDWLRDGHAPAESADLLEQYALGRIVTKEDVGAMWTRLEELDGDV
jgi:hypothetical protein